MVYATLIKIASSLLFSLLTEAFLKELVARSLEWAAKQSHTDVDDQLVQAVKKAWNVQ